MMVASLDRRVVGRMRSARIERPRGAGIIAGREPRERPVSAGVHGT